jgi:glycosyltransferase involved in cell wall biosynthesis
MLKKNKIKIIGLIRERNESLILKDTLNHLAQHVDRIIVFDDASMDDSVKIARLHPSVLEVIENKFWSSKNRELEETRSRQKLLSIGLKYKPDWFFYMDADERIEGEVKKFLYSPISNNIDGIRGCLFDAYLTPDDHKPYKEGKLYNFRRYFGPEAREILMIFRNKPGVRFIGLAAREPFFKGRIITKFYCQHYGKALSVKHWEETCDFYSKYFKSYSEKWKDRKGKAIHIKSDFGRKLYLWHEAKRNKVVIYRYQSCTLINRLKSKLMNLIK